MFYFFAKPVVTQVHLKTIKGYPVTEKNYKCYDNTTLDDKVSITRLDILGREYETEYALKDLKPNAGLFSTLKVVPENESLLLISAKTDYSKELKFLIKTIGSKYAQKLPDSEPQKIKAI
jgi:hypothetical protein